MRNTTLKYSFRGFLLVFLFLALLMVSASAASINGTVWIDQNNDGLYAKGEDGLRNVTVTLESVSGGTSAALAETKTEKDGSFSFTSVRDGTYLLRIKLPSEYRFALPGKDSAALPASGSESATEAFAVAGQNVEMNIGATRSSSSVTFVAFEDLNANGGRMNSEPLIRDVQIDMYYMSNGTMRLIASASTNRNGEAKIGTLSPAEYLISVTLPDGYTFGPLGQKINQWYNCMPLSDGVYGLSNPVEVPAKTNMGFGIGMVKTGTITGSVWLDANASGKASQGTMLSGMTVSLTNNDNGLSRTAVTDAEGVYRFINLPAGNYTLAFPLPETYMFTYGDSLFTDPRLREGALDRIVLETGEDIRIDPVGVMPDTGLEVQAYIDSNLNGTYDIGEPLFEGAALRLEAAGGSFEAMTGPDGSCAFHGLTGDSVLVHCDLPEGYIFTKDGGDSLLSYLDGSASGSNQVSITLGTTTWAFIGVTQPSKVTGVLYEDAAEAGSFTAGSALLSDYKVQLIGENSSVIAETATDSNGAYVFENLPGGLYKVRFLYKDPYIASAFRGDDSAARPNRITTQNMDYGETDAFMLAAAETKVLDAALYQAGSIDGYVLLNPAYDSLHTSEGGLKGVKVTLLSEDGTLFADFLTDETNGDGHYYIKGIPAGTYLVCLNAPDLSVFVYPVMGSRQWTSEPVKVESGKNVTLDSVGAVKTSIFSGNVVIDPASVNPGTVQATVELRSQTFGTLLTRQTDAQGRFEFRGLLPGTYDLTVTANAGYLFTGSTDGFVPMSTTNRASCAFTVEMGSDWQDRTITVALPSALSLKLFYDENNSGLMDSGDSPVSGLAFTIEGPGGEQEVTTDAEGMYSMEDLYPGKYTLHFGLNADTILPGGHEDSANEWSIELAILDGESLQKDIPVLVLGSISGAVWNLDGENDQINDLPIRLWLDGEQVAETASDRNGRYRFDRLYPGEYTLEAELPEDYVFARVQDTSSRTSVIQNTGAEKIVLRMGQNAEDQDIGIGAIGSIGDFVWLDENKNGLQDIGEPGVPGIEITLKQYGFETSHVTTDAYGLYEILHLYPGVYQVCVDLPAEVMGTRQRSDFALVSSVLPENSEGHVEFEITVSSGTSNLNIDMGLALKQDGVYPQNMDDVPTRDWTPYTDRR